MLCIVSRAGSASKNTVPPKTLILNRSLARGFAIPTKEEVPERLALPQGQETPPPVLFAVMEHVAALAERSQVPRPVVRRIMVQVCSG